MELLAIVVDVVVDVCDLGLLASERKVCRIVSFGWRTLSLLLLLDHLEFIGNRNLGFFELVFTYYI